MAPFNPDRNIPTYPGTDDTLNPTDWLILSILGTGRRHSRTSIARLLRKDTGYVSQRITEVLSYGLARRVGPGDRSNLYEATPTGYAVLHGANEPTHEEQTTPHGRLLYATPQLYDMLEALYDEPLLTTEMHRILDAPEPFEDMVIDTLQYYGLVNDVSISVTRQYGDDEMGTTEHNEPGFVLTELGESVVEHKDAWLRGGNPELTAAITSRL